MKVAEAQYNTFLQHGTSMFSETRTLLRLWKSPMPWQELAKLAVTSGDFAQISAQRIRNIVKYVFAPRYLVNDNQPARILQQLVDRITIRDFEQILFVYTCRANPILGDFVRNVYWNLYSSGKTSLGNEDALEFVLRAVSDGLTNTAWPETRSRRVASDITRCCADYGLLETGPKSVRQMQPFVITTKTLIALAYDLHFLGLGDNQVLAAEDWKLFGLERDDVLAELKRQALQGKLIVQSAGAVTKISWSCKSIEEIADVVA
jgi:hypothetical protein